jgi:hypothetical protein
VMVEMLLLPRSAAVVVTGTSLGLLETCDW